MSIQSALNFIGQVYRNHQLKELIQKDLQTLDLDEMVRIGARYGFNFDVQELQEAFSKDWSLRKCFYGKK